MSLVAFGLLAVGSMVQPRQPAYVAPNIVLPEFFAANYLIDKDQDGSASDDEWVGACKTQFRVNEQISFVGSTQQPIGTHLRCVVRSPTGEVFNTEDYTQVFAYQSKHYDWSVRDLVDKFGVGVWTAEWSVEGRLVAICQVTLSR
jgi:predicted amidohydrolase